jgi:hypothetical protein
MNMSDQAAEHRPFSRRQLLAGGCATVAGLTAVQGSAQQPATRPVAGPDTSSWPKPIKAFCIDFNWSGGQASPPGTYAHADPPEHVRWYRDLGANTIQTFCVSYNGYAWYPSDVAPVTPGLKSPNFLGEMVELGHKAGMRVMGYFTLGANPHWEKLNPDLVHGGDSHDIKIPMTLEYLDHFCRSVEDAMLKTGVDGFMIDWVRPTRHQKWLACEKEMYRQLLGEKSPESGGPSAEMVLEFDRRAMERAWRHIRWTVRATGPAVIWTNHPFLKNEYPLWTGHRLLREVDWVLNEAPELDHLDWLRQQVGPRTLIIQNLCGWKGHDASMWKKIDPKATGFYGYARADDKTTLPDGAIEVNMKNIEILREAYHSL